ncbi:MAG: hypothetical protein ACRBN8_11115 [Nannocystales bacterium]
MSVTPSPWKTSAATKTEPVQAALPGWDPASDINVGRVVRVDLPQLMAETGLANGSTVRLTAGWLCPQTRTREISDQHDLRLTEKEESVEAILKVFAKGANLANSLILETRLLLVSRADASSPTSARLTGSVLWESRQPLQLEGDESRFPTEWADFESAVYKSAAAWALDWDPNDLDCSTLGAVRVLVNQRHERVAALLRERPPSAEALVLWDALRLDVARQLMTGALANDVFMANPNAFGDGTLGATIRRMFVVHFPRESLRALAATSPSIFETSLQASLEAYRQR